MVSIKSRSVESGNQEPSWLINHQNTCPQMYGRLAASAIKRYVRMPPPLPHPLPILFSYNLTR